MERNRMQAIDSLMDSMKNCEDKANTEWYDKRLVSWLQDVPNDVKL